MTGVQTCALPIYTGHENDANDDAAGCDGGPDEDGSEPDFAQLVTTINPKEPPMN